MRIMKIVLMGPPGAGKGTYASRLNRILRIPHISTGDIVRSEIHAKTVIGKKIKKYSDKGDLVPDKIILRLLATRLKKDDCKNGFILDGFPRTINQAEIFENIINVDVVINLEVSDKIVITRLSNRIVCKDCGLIFNLLTLKPKKDGLCDNCEGQLYQRIDDKIETIQDRLGVYRKETKPLMEYYDKKGILENITCINLLTTPESIIEKILNIIKKLEINV
jgi:adenylate kinase